MTQVLDRVKAAVLVVPKEVTWHAALTEILQANEEPRHDVVDMSVAARWATERAFVQKQFEKCLEQVSMDPNLLFFNEPYETQYVSFMNAVNRSRVRLCFSIGAAASAILFWYEARYLELYDADKNDKLTLAQEHTLYWLSFGLIVPTFAFGFALSFLPVGKTRLESLASSVYMIVAMAFITKKCVQEAKGPIYPLVILLIPLFNVTRTRFAITCVVGWFIVLVFFIVNLSAGPDPTSSTVFTTLNYSMSVVAGMVSSYQKEILKRRNFTLGLNFSGAPSDASSRIHNPYYAKELLCHRWSQSFKHKDVERRFFRYWYLLDRHPYENPNAGILHMDVYVSLRYPLAGVCLNQVVLLLQDVINLYKTPTQYIALGFRVGCIMPAYMFLFSAIYFMSRTYAKEWLAANQAPPPQAADDAAKRTTDSISITTVVVKSKDAMKNQAKKAANKVKDGLVETQKGYSRTIQALTGMVLLFHVYLTGTLVYVIARNIGVKDVYFMGFLNTMMAAHRSSFRPRFMLSATVTLVACIGFLVGTRTVLPRRTLIEYSCYITVVQILGMIVSYEEENLRRSFFIKKSLRSLEFKAWLSSLVKIQVWIRKRMIKRALEAKARIRALERVQTNPSAANRKSVLDRPLEVVDIHKNLRDLQTHLNKDNKVVTSASAKLSQASRYGVYSTCVSVLIAIGQVSFFLAKQ
ncbi:hypothetical protein LEN26_012776 [Aphanomyces euteiches]|nr:hypothetical protein AeMF1_016749 [Aphanomyces euteiches]KAH9117122.1 hypothetical protein LEN26_012776 [Aphanomyces euteiches]